MRTKTNTFKVVMTAMMICLIMVAILFIRVPIPFTQGYVHFGDAMVFLAVLVLGWKYGAVAAALGGMLGDIVGGAAAWAPWSLGIKGIMALILGGIIAMFAKKGTFSKGTPRRRDSRNDSGRSVHGGRILFRRGDHVWELDISAPWYTLEYRTVCCRRSYCCDYFSSIVQDSGKIIFCV